MLDLARADDVLSPTDDASELARYMSRDGLATVSVRLAQRRTATATELVCLMCTRPGQPGRQRANGPTGDSSQ